MLRRLQIELRDSSNTTFWQQQIGGAPITFVIHPQTVLSGCE